MRATRRRGGGQQRRACNPGRRVYNLGMVGFGTDLMLRAFEQVVHSDDLRRVSPTYNGMGFPLPEYELEEGWLVSVPYRDRAPWERPLVLQGVRFACWRFSRASFALNAAILDRIRELASNPRAALVLAYAPPPNEAWHDRMREEFLAEWASERGVPFVDLRPAGRYAGRAYLEGDLHWSVAGHEMVAEVLAPVL